MTPTALTGGCLCGAIRYRVSGPPVDAGLCHCRLCQRATGAPVVGWATFPLPAFALERGAPTRFASSPVAERAFCATCGTALTFTALHEPQRIDITLASLDDPDALPPEYHVWVTSQRPWLVLGDALPRHNDDGPDRL